MPAPKYTYTWDKVIRAKELILLIDSVVGEANPNEYSKQKVQFREATPVNFLAYHPYFLEKSVFDFNKYRQSLAIHL